MRGSRGADESADIARSSAPGLEATVAEFLASGAYDRHLRRLRVAVARNVERYREAIAEEFSEGTRVASPRGGFVLWVAAA